MRPCDSKPQAGQTKKHIYSSREQRVRSISNPISLIDKRLLHLPRSISTWSQVDYAHPANLSHPEVLLIWPSIDCNTTILHSIIVTIDRFYLIRHIPYHLSIAFHLYRLGRYFRRSATIMYERYEDFWMTEWTFLTNYCTKSPSGGAISEDRRFTIECTWVTSSSTMKIRLVASLMGATKSAFPAQVAGWWNFKRWCC